MPLVEDDNVVQTLAADRADDAFDVGSPWSRLEEGRTDPGTREWMTHCRRNDQPDRIGSPRWPTKLDPDRIEVRL